MGGIADQILLWPFGGVAYVQPPQRPGATLWSIVAGPLVNVALLPVLFAAMYAARSLGLPHTLPDAYLLLRWILYIDISLLVFNILPIYPLDGGQILRSLLWFVLGKARSLMVATLIGLLGLVGFVAVAVWLRSVWLGAMAVFLLMNCWGGLQHARQLLRQARLPRRAGFACPSCKVAPPIGDYWRCGACQQPFDTFQTQGECPHCSARFNATMCPDCHEQHPMMEWVNRGYAGAGTVIDGNPAR